MIIPRPPHKKAGSLCWSGLRVQGGCVRSQTNGSYKSERANILPQTDGIICCRVLVTCLVYTLQFHCQ